MVLLKGYPYGVFVVFLIFIFYREGTPMGFFFFWYFDVLSIFNFFVLRFAIEKSTGLLFTPSGHFEKYYFISF